MNKNVLIVLAGGFVIAVLVALLVQATLSGAKKKEVKVKEAPMVSIVVAAKPIKTGESITKDNVKWQSWPKSAQFEGLIVKQGDKAITELAEGRALRAITAGEPVLKKLLVSKNSPNFLAAALSPGMRAVAIGVNATSMAGGFVSPGDRVDIILTYRPRVQNPDNDPLVERVADETVNRLASETILENVKILAVDQRVGNSEDGKIRVGKTVTVEVSPADSEKLALARKLGDMSLALRQLGDQSVAKSERVTTDERVLSIDDDVRGEIERRRQNGTGQAGNNVRIYSGGVMEQIKVSN